MALTSGISSSARVVVPAILIAISAIYFKQIIWFPLFRNHAVFLPLVDLLDCPNADLLQPLHFRQTPDYFVLAKEGTAGPDSPSNPPLLSAVTTFFGSKDAANLASFLQEIANQSLFRNAQAEILAGTTVQQVCAAPRAAISQLLAFFSAPHAATLVFFKRDPGLYGVWNALIKDFAGGSLITNANMDDHRRWDAWALKTSRLVISEPDIGVISGPVHFASYPVESWTVAEATGLHQLHLMFDDVAGRDDLRLIDFFRINTLDEVDAVWPFNFPHNAPVWRRDLHTRLGYFNTSFSPFSDFEFWLRCRAAGERFAVLEEAVDIFYEDPESFSKSRWGGASYERKVAGVAGYLFRKYIRDAEEDTLKA